MSPQVIWRYLLNGDEVEYIDTERHETQVLLLQGMERQEIEHLAGYADTRAIPLDILSPNRVTVHTERLRP